MVDIQKAEAILDVGKAFPYLVWYERQEFDHVLFFFCFFNFLLRCPFTTLIFSSMHTTIHNIGELIRVVLVADLVYFDRVKIKHIDELSQLLDYYDLVTFVGQWVLRWDQFVIYVVFAHNWGQHFIDLVSTAFSFEKSKKHPFKHFRRNMASLIFDHFI